MKVYTVWWLLDEIKPWAVVINYWLIGLTSGTTGAPVAQQPPVPRLASSSTTMTTMSTSRRPVIVYTSSSTTTTSSTILPPIHTTRYPPKKTPYNTSPNVKNTSKKSKCPTSCSCSYCSCLFFFLSWFFFVEHLHGRALIKVRWWLVVVPHIEGSHSSFFLSPLLLLHLPFVIIFQLLLKRFYRARRDGEIYY